MQPLCCTNHNQRLTSAARCCVCRVVRAVMHYVCALVPIKQCLFLSGENRTENISNNSIMKAEHRDNYRCTLAHLHFQHCHVLTITYLTYLTRSFLELRDIFPPHNPSKSQGRSPHCSGSPAPKLWGSQGSSGWWMEGSFLVRMLHLYLDTDSYNHLKNTYLITYWT